MSMLMCFLIVLCLKLMNFEFVVLMLLTACVAI